MAELDMVRMGGLLRCCILSIQEAPPGKEGDIIGCNYHQNVNEPQARFREGAWEWVGVNRDAR